MNDNVPDSWVDLSGFSTVSADTDAKLGNNRWFHYRKKILCQDIKQSFHIIVYILLWAAVAVVCEVICKTAARIQIQQRSAFIAIMEDFNNITLCSRLTGFVQFFFFYCPIRGKKWTLHLCYRNAKDAYSASALPPPGRSDHNLAFLQYIYPVY